MASLWKTLYIRYESKLICEINYILVDLWWRWSQKLLLFSGKPAALDDISNPDWVPSQHLGYEKIQTSSSSNVERYERLLKRKALGVETSMAETDVLSEPTVDSEVEVGLLLFCECFFPDFRSIMINFVSGKCWFSFFE